jgi:hypothetical protein
MPQAVASELATWQTDAHVTEAQTAPAKVVCLETPGITVVGGARKRGPTALSGRTQSTASSAGPAHVLTASVRNELSGEICNTWVIHTLWWEPSQTVWREYLKVVTDTGMLCVIFRDLLRGGWFLVRIFD